MASVSFTQNIQRHIECPTVDVEAETVREALDRAFDGNDRARGYVLDEHGGVRKHMVVFVDGRPIKDRDGLSDPISKGSQVYVMQALSGG